MINAIFLVGKDINQEMTLTFVPKIIITFVALIVFGPWIIRILLNDKINFINSDNIEKSSGRST
jgi:flagellar biosynthesis protein FliQ